ncbi:MULTISPECIES: hypothetical protein [Campylobacter]|uniref:hypothetical protein n=1 Tax=Campylobacter TaxID=194 RepID=UPI0008739D4E|nr:MULTISPECIES: hypothetical protein [Campylobacter]ECP9363189.1 hypothetical protein [Campylobacter jejuni]OEW22128.1 hypothetical protein AJ939_04445 [Campylobacter sp. BCW_6889]OEW26287.1 hypothetical protein AJ874_04085 [Campylobacter jejuni]RTI74983.1 hypothetical protein C3I12_03910 [Campylobacter jejuni]RTI88022.1 hypothetical protein C3I07_03310 [Campylobacter jejuni]
MIEVIIAILLFLILLAILGYKREADSLLGCLLMIPIGIISFLFEILLHLLLSPIYIIAFFMPSKEKKALSKLEIIKKENEELRIENEELLNKRDLLLKKINKRHKYE